MEPAHHLRRLTLRRAAEALLFEATEPVPARAIAAAFAKATGEDASEEDAVAAVDALAAHLDASGSALGVFAWAGGYRLATRADVKPVLDAARQTEAKSKKLSGSLVETLAVVAYRQPVTKPEVDFVRGVDADYALRRLAELGFVDAVGRGDGVGRPLLYGTTPAFLEAFGLARLEDLPTLREVEDLLADPAFSRERARLLALQSVPPDPSSDADPAP